MSILKYAVLGAAVVYGIKHLTKKREDGTSLMDDINERSPEFVNKAKSYATETIDSLSNTLKERLA